MNLPSIVKRGHPGMNPSPGLCQDPDYEVLLDLEKLKFGDIQRSNVQSQYAIFKGAIATHRAIT